MNGLVFDFNNVMSSRIGKHGFSDEDISAGGGLLKSAHASFSAKPYGFKRLPEGQADIVDDIIRTAADIRKKYKNFVVLGIGGSALGPIAVHQALSHDKEAAMKLYVADNIDPETMAKLMNADHKETVFNVISKSGKTSETMAQFMAVAGALQKQGLRLCDHVIATTDSKNGNLVRIAQKEGLKTFVIPDDVGGRFSELTPVGLLAAAACVYDIKAMLKGAARINDMCNDDNNPAAIFALLHVLGMKRQMNISVMMPYADSLKYISDWYAQLWAESLGKKYDTEGKIVYAGQTPVKALGVTDQHSQIQLYTEGPFDKIVTFLKVKNFRRDTEIPKAFEYVDDIDFLGGKTFGQLLEAERSATEYALIKAGRPNITITLESVNEYTIGALLQFFEAATAYAGEMLGINAFDQPGVEEGKKATFALMGKEGFEAKKAEMESQPPYDSKWIYSI